MKHCIRPFAIIYLLLSITFTGCSSAEKDKQQLYQSALDYIEKGETEAAILDLKSAIQIDPKFEPARYKLGLIYFEEKKFNEAFNELTRAASLNPQNIDANLKVAQFYFLTKKFEDARKHIDNVMISEPDNEDALIILASIETANKKYDEALATLNKVDKRVNQDANLQKMKAGIYVAKKQNSLAEKAYRRAIELDKNNFSSYAILLHFYEQIDDKSKARALLDEMLANFPEKMELHLLLAGYYRKYREYDKVEEELKKVIQLAPDQENGRLFLADFYYKSGRGKDALETLSTASQELPESVAIQAQLASVYFDMQKFEEAEKIINDLNNKAPEHQSLKLLNARKLIRDKNFNDSVPILQKLNTDYPNWAAPYFYLAVAHLGMGNIDLAQLEASNAIQKDKLDPKFHTLAAQIQLIQGNFDEAAKESSIALQLNNKNIKAVLILSKSLLGLKKYDKAYDILNKVNQQLPDNKDVLLSLVIASFNTRNFETGETALNRLLELDPGNQRAVTIFLNYKFNNDLNGAEGFVREQLEKSPDNPVLFIMLGEILAKQNNKSAALGAYEQARELAPDNALPYLRIAKLHVVLGNTDKALEEYEAILEKNPKFIPALMGIASLQEGKGDVEKAKATYEEILKIQDDQPIAANNLAWILASEPEGDLGRALLLAMTAKKISPEDPNIADTLGWVYFKRGSYPLAIAQFELALKQKKDNPIVLYHLALAQNADMKKDKAFKTIQKSLEKNTPFPGRKDAEKLLQELEASQLQ